MKSKEIDYTDQSIISNTYDDRCITSAWTSYGIKVIESEYCTRIRNINNKVKKVYAFDRVKEIFIGKYSGKECEGDYKDVVEETEPFNPKYRGFGARVVWENDEEHDFIYGEPPTFDLLTGKENPNSLMKEIKENPHLHDDIKQNLILNLNNYIEHEQKR